MIIELGNQYRFNYGVYAVSPDPDCYPDHSAHRGQTVTALSFVQYEPGEPTYVVVTAADGWKGEALPDELEIIA